MEQANPYIIDLIRSSKMVENFDHSITVEWAISLLQKGEETPNILMLGSFSKTIDNYEIRPYISKVLNDLNLDEISGHEAALSIIRYYITEILIGRLLRKNLRILYELCNQFDHAYGLLPFYLLYFSWYDLEAGEENHYYDGATLNNIESLLKKEANDWIIDYN